jgi:hypothetical protein
MKHIDAIIFLLVLAGAFFGCATLSKNECLQADWYELGYRDGSIGARRSLFQEHSDACLKHKVHADRQSYFKGRDEGLRVYCTHNNGFNQGKAGSKYHRVCPPEVESDFLAGYTKGHEIYKYESQMAALENRLRSIERQIQDKEKQLVSSNLSYETREKIRADIRYLDLKYRDVARELRFLEKMNPTEQ